jgi:hypothetical protein
VLIPGQEILPTVYRIKKLKKRLSVYFDLNSAFDLSLHSLFTDKISSYGFSAGHVTWLYRPC